MTKSLYHIRKIVWLTRDNNGVQNMNSGYGKADFVVYKGTDSYLEFYVKDIDRKPINLLGKSLSISIINFYTNELMLVRNLEIVNAQRGQCKVKLNYTDTMAWERGNYKYSIQLIDEEGLITMLFVDQNTDARGWIDFRDDLLPKPSETIEIIEFTPISLSLSEPAWTTGALKGNSQAGYSDNISTISIQMNNFTGSVILQGSLDIQPSEDSNNWFDIGLSPQPIYSNYTGTDAFNFEGNYQWIRIYYTQTSGSIEKILYKI